jgi:hypothetical protein
MTKFLDGKCGKYEASLTKINNQIRLQEKNLSFLLSAKQSLSKKIRLPQRQFSAHAHEKNIFNKFST